jgi:hypothetical protein
LEQRERRSQLHDPNRRSRFIPFAVARKSNGDRFHFLNEHFANTDDVVAGARE